MILIRLTAESWIPFIGEEEMDESNLKEEELIFDFTGNCADACKEYFHLKILLSAVSFLT